MADDPTAGAADPLEAGVRAFVDDVMANTARRSGPAGLSRREARRVAEEVRAPWRIGGPRMASVRERAAPAGDHEVRVRIYDPTGAKPNGALVYLHGGGWALFSLDTHDRLMREYARRSGLAVIGVDYSLSPEAKFPTALEEILHVFAWLAREGPALGVDPARVAVGGDSAGANLALAACLRLRDDGRPGAARAMLLNYGVFQTAISDATVARYGGPRFMLTAEEMAGFWGDYLRGPQDAENPLVSPMLADLAGLPAAFLAIAECDILAEQDAMMAERLKAAGVETRAIVYPGASHSFLEAVAVSPLSARALDEASAWLKARLH